MMKFSVFYIRRRNRDDRDDRDALPNISQENCQLNSDSFTNNG